MKCIFAYSEFSAFGCTDDYDGFKIVITDTGIIDYKITNIDGEFKFRKKYQISTYSIQKIQSLINKNKKIFKFYDDLDINVLDGTGHEFYFLNNNKKKRITAWNIEESQNYSFIWMFILFIISFFNNDIKELYKNVKQERFLLKLFFKISDILKNEGYLLELYNFSKI